MLISTAYLGNIQYFSKLSLEGAKIEAHENFQKQSYRNRAEIMTASGMRPLTVPVVWRHGEKMAIRDVRIDYAMPWQREHWRTLQAAYAAAPYFEHYAEKLEPFYDHSTYAPRTLWTLNDDMTRMLLNLLKRTPACSEMLHLTTEYTPPTPLDEAVAKGDFREIISHKPRLQRPDTGFHSPEYYQVFSDRTPFAPNLSVVDLLLCEGPAAAQIIRESCV